MIRNAGAREPPIERKFGYDHMVEMNAIRNEMRAEGITDFSTLHFGAVERYIARHMNDPTYRETSRRIAGSATAVMSDNRLQRFEAALREIAAGHNDAMNLARRVLGL